MNISEFKNSYFVGIGGIGMSALVRYFALTGKNVAGYDRTESLITMELEKLNIQIHFNDDVKQIPKKFKNNEDTLVIYTPAIPSEHKELNYFKNNNFSILKRSKILGIIAQNYKTIAVAGTHAKTTTSTMIAHLLKKSSLDCTAFLGGIAKNYQSNFIHADKSNWLVAEADEYDRSFWQLFPQVAVVTSLDADHLDIYKNKNDLKQAFNQFASQIKDEGYLIVKKGIDFCPKTKCKQLFYSLNDCNADFYAQNIEYKNGAFYFDFIVKNKETIRNLKLSFPGLINVENAIAAIAVAKTIGVENEEIKQAIDSFQGIKRRFDILFQNQNCIYIDDYAHHPQEINALYKSVKAMYPDKEITAVFQPHLFSRTRDFIEEFAQALSQFDRLILLEIYPAREKPIEGITSQVLWNKIKTNEKYLFSKKQVLEFLTEKQIPVLLTVGAGDIGTMTKEITKILNKKRELEVEII